MAHVYQLWTGQIKDFSKISPPQRGLLVTRIRNGLPLCPEREARTNSFGVTGLRVRFPTMQ
jgi:hypothetical protein